jgi:hypothetical protein
MGVLATVVLRFFWRLVVADAKRLLEDPNYRPIVFMRSFSDEGTTITSKRLFDRLAAQRESRTPASRSGGRARAPDL